SSSIGSNPQPPPDRAALPITLHEGDAPMPINDRAQKGTATPSICVRSVTRQRRITLRKVAGWPSLHVGVARKVGRPARALPPAPEPPQHVLSIGQDLRLLCCPRAVARGHGRPPSAAGPQLRARGRYPRC